MTPAMEITEYDIEICWDSSQYWHGAGLTYTDFDDIATGIGQSKHEAAEDACEQLACQGYDTSTIDISAYSKKYVFLCECAEDDDCDHHYFVTIRVK